MPRAKQIPAYRLHRLTGQARARIDGQDRYRGRDGSPESRQEYARPIAEHFRPGAGSDLPKQDGFLRISINELFVCYLEFAQGYYLKDGMDCRPI